MRQRGKEQWGKDDAQAKAVRALGKKVCYPPDRSDRTDPADEKLYHPWLNHADPSIVANAMICLIHQANYLLDQQISGLERSFINEGGYSEQLAAARVKKRRGEAHKNQAPNQALPPCPLCGQPLVLRTAKQGKNTGAQFLGCSGYPACKGTHKIPSRRLKAP